MTTITVEAAGSVTIGRRDYGMGWTGRLMMVGGEPFAVVTLSKSGEQWFTPCGWCDPIFSGSKFYYGHVMAGVCFQCNGAGTKARRDSEAEAVKMVRNRIKARERAATKREQAEAKRAAEHAAWVESHADVVSMLAEVNADRGQVSDDQDQSEAEYAADAAWYARWGGFVTDMAQQVRYRALSDKQVVAVTDAVRQAKADQEAQATREAAQRFYGVQGDKVTATGTVVVRATYETFYGYSPTLNCLLVVTGHGEHEGVTFKIAGTGKTLWDAAKGDVIEITGTVKAHDVYEGVKQTTMTRTKVKILETAS